MSLVFIYTTYDNLISCNATITVLTSTTPIFLNLEPLSEKCNGVMLLLGIQI